MRPTSRRDRRAIAAEAAMSSGTNPSHGSMYSYTAAPAAAEFPYEHLIDCGKREIPDQPRTR